MCLREMVLREMVIQVTLDVSEGDGESGDTRRVREMVK